LFGGVADLGVADNLPLVKEMPSIVVYSAIGARIARACQAVLGLQGCGLTEIKVDGKPDRAEMV
jgi:hypothetical protein